MNIEAINKWLDEEYGCSYTRLEELHDFYFEKYCDLQQENSQLKCVIQTYDILLKSNVEENKRLMQEIKNQEQAQVVLDNQLAKLNSKITKALEKIEDYNLGKYDYSIPPIGVIELKEILEGKSK